MLISEDTVPADLVWHEASGHAQPADGRLLDQYKIEWFKELNRSLRDELSDAEFIRKIDANVRQLATLAAEIADVIRTRCPGVDLSALEEKLPRDLQRPASALLEPVWYAAA